MELDISSVRGLEGLRYHPSFLLGQLLARKKMQRAAIISITA